MRDARLALLVGPVLLFIGVPLYATPTPVPAFNQCPTVGIAQSCAYLLVLGPGGSVNLLFDQNVKDVDTQEDILVGIQNNSGYSIPRFTWAGINFPGLPNGAHTYLELKDSFDYGEQKNNDNDDDDKHVAPEPSSIALLGSGLAALGAILLCRVRS